MINVLLILNTLLLLVVILQRRIPTSILKEIKTLMATQEERLQAIAAKIDEVLSDLAELKANNPQIEDEISAIEAKLSIGGEPEPEPTPEPTPEP